MTVLVTLDLGLESGFTRFDTETRELLLGWNNWRKLPAEDRNPAFGDWLDGLIRGTLFDIHGQIEQTDLAPVAVLGYEKVSFSGPGAGGSYIWPQQGILQYVGRDIAWQGVEVPTLNKFAVGDNPTPIPPRLKEIRKEEKSKVLTIVEMKALKAEKNRLNAERRKVIKRKMIEAAEAWIRKLGHEPPENLKTDTADATLVLGWMLTNSVKGWSL